VTSPLENLCGPGKPLGLGPEVWRVLAKCHEVRNLGEYEGDLNIDERLVAGLIEACRAVAAALEKLTPPG
jgi:hypothetical protein